ncbi:MAG: hypothetical protein KKD28_05825 [Chloroflexi bacterium]|nr:hypothetical protein [Chloroflexota bacterium]
MLSQFDGLWWLLLLLGPLIFLQRTLHRELQAVLLLLSRRVEIALVMFSLLFFPGVLLHELSHYLMARLLRVRTERFSLIPRRMGDNRLQMGFVETVQTDILRDALIGSAPLVAGGVFVAYAGVMRLGFLSLWDALVSGNLLAAADGIAAIYALPDFWLWFYMIVAVSSTMLPSSSDRRAWLPVVLVTALVIGLAVLFGAGPWMSVHLLPPLNEALRAVAVVFAISSAVHLIVLAPIWMLRKSISRLTGMQVG